MGTDTVAAIRGIFANLAPPLIPLASALVGGYLGSYLTVRQQRLQRHLDDLAARFAALREVMKVAENVPRALSYHELQERLAADPELHRALTSRLIRLFGLRIELTPYLDSEIRDFIDGTFKGLYATAAGSYELRVNDEVFADVAVQFRRLTTRVEEKLIAEHKRLTT
jgi:hypothetical protein